MKIKSDKLLSIIMLLILVGGLLPLMYLGRYNHATGDDYYYGAVTGQVWQETGNLFATIQKAAEGVALEYNQWQGTYSAMFLMYLPPQIFGDFAYRLIPTVLLSLLTGGIFYLCRQLLCRYMNFSAASWITVSSCLTFLCVQNVPTAGESFYWYNGSMYYTGYLGVTLFFLGITLKYAEKGGLPRLALLLFLALFLAGGNYVTLLPCLLLVFLYAAWLFYRKNKYAYGIAATEVALIAGLLISAAAPGNRVRQGGMWQIPAWKAVAKSLLQGIRYTEAWGGLWWLLIAAIITPILWRQFKNTNFRFRYPVIVIGLIYGIFCSMSCPTFYTMNSTGPARAVAAVYYGFHLFSFLAYGYFLGYLSRVWRDNYANTEKSTFIVTILKWGQTQPVMAAVKIAVPCLLLTTLIFTGKAADTNTATAITLLTSGRAQAYEQEYQERRNILLNDSIQTVVFKSYTNRPELLYVGDISPDPDAPENIAFAQFFNKESVIVEYE